MSEDSRDVGLTDHTEALVSINTEKDYIYSSLTLVNKTGIQDETVTQAGLSKTNIMVKKKQNTTVNIDISKSK